ncbi:MAG TPA: Glu/Leu/Phe/Val dehydrogenase dimerization domain-containing protein [Acidimicrobiales bacterium]|nr:Glu/Leu/Phe/Val dehydrogenase dimerization domain-containing protein [Acidimicrobiales bacterium]
MRWVLFAPVPVFERIRADGHEEVVYCHDPASGLRAIVAIHSTRLGPALGGTRFYPYPSEDDALDDVLRLSKGMTYKAAAAGLDLGGGKAVILGDPREHKSEALLRAYGRFLQGLGGRYITAEDVGTTQPDMDVIRRETTHVTGVSRSLGGSGDPSEATAYGVLHAMRAVARILWGSTALEGRHIVITGVGKVGYALARHLVEERARISVADVNDSAAERAARDFGATPVEAKESHSIECDIWSPCALGGALSPASIAELRCGAVVGSANNQLATPECGDLVEERGILYAPDFVVNAGGVINISEELSPKGYHRERAYGIVRRIYDTTTTVIATARTEGITTAAAANRVAERRIEQLSNVRLLRTSREEGRP